MHVNTKKAINPPKIPDILRWLVPMISNKKSPHEQRLGELPLYMAHAGIPKQATITGWVRRVPTGRRTALERSLREFRAGVLHAGFAIDAPLRRVCNLRKALCRTYDSKHCLGLSVYGQF